MLSVRPPKNSLYRRPAGIVQSGFTVGFVAGTSSSILGVLELRSFWSGRRVWVSGDSPPRILGRMTVGIRPVSIWGNQVLTVSCR